MIELDKNKIFFNGEEIGRYWKRNNHWSFEVYGCYYTSAKGVSNCGQCAYSARTLREVEMYARIVYQYKEKK
jgi:hypothetical protein